MLKRSLAALAAVSLLTLAACGNDDDDTSAVDTPSATPSDDSSFEVSVPQTESASPETGPVDSCEYAASGQPARDVSPPPAAPAYSGDVSVTIETTAGDIPITLHADDAPCTVNSFLSLAEQDFYDNTPCPRLGYQPGFAILQCGDPTGTGGGGPGYTVQDELTGNETYPAGTIAMANSSRPDTNGSQFFLVFADSGFPPSYTVFGTIDQAGIDLLLAVGEQGEDGSHPAGGGAPNQEVTFIDVVIND